MYAAVSRITTIIIVAGLVVVLGVNAASTYEDYFVKWPQHPETQFVFQADFAAIAEDIDARDVMDVSVGGLSNDTMDDPSLYLLRQRKDVRVRWFDSGSPLSSGGALNIPNAAGSIYIPNIVPVASDFEVWLACESEDAYRRCNSEVQLREREQSPSAEFGEAAGFVAAGIPSRSVRAGNQLQIGTFWRAGNRPQPGIRMFMHLVDPSTGYVLAQHDGLDAPMQFWRKGDAIFQLHQLKIPADTAAGQYELRLGLYNPETGQRVLQTGDYRGPADDYTILGTIEVTR